MARSTIRIATTLSLILLVAACVQAQMDGPQSDHDQHAAMVQDIQRAVAVLVPTRGNDVRGVVRFEQTEEGVKITADISGLDPNSEHGFHIHQYGDLTSTDGSSAGGHYSPRHHPHALPDNEPRHAGDLGNIEADGQGRAHVELVAENITLDGMKNPVLGRGVVVHAEPDDGGQPSGNAGSRVAVGVIGVASPAE